MESISTKPPAKEPVIAKTNPSPTRIPTASQPDKKASTAKTRLSLVERQTLVNGPRRASDTAPQKRRTSSLHKPLPPPAVPPSITDIYRFPSESPVKQSPSPVKPIHHPKHTSYPSSNTEDKENAAPSWSLNGPRERRKTFNITLEKLAKMTREEMQADKEWEADLADKRRRQSVAL